ncbi:hypothetical protein [Caenispirillum bisanense]|nr:hypothetical protein [Caenispirillum bisanense]
MNKEIQISEAAKLTLTNAAWGFLTRDGEKQVGLVRKSKSRPYPPGGSFWTSRVIVNCLGFSSTYTSNIIGSGKMCTYVILVDDDTTTDDMEYLATAIQIAAPDIAMPNSFDEIMRFPYEHVSRWDAQFFWYLDEINFWTNGALRERAFAMVRPGTWARKLNKICHMLNTKIHMNTMLNPDKVEIDRILEEFDEYEWLCIRRGIVTTISYGGASLIVDLSQPKPRFVIATQDK